MEPASRLQHVHESVIREMTRLAYKHGAINLSQGYPDFSAPQEIKDAAKRAIDEDRNQYTITWGVPELRQALARYLDRNWGLEFDPEQHVTVTCGVTEAIVAALMARVEPGEEVVIMEPFHENYLPAAVFAGGNPVFYTMEPPDYRVDALRLRSLFNERTAAIIVNTPHNPTGRVFDREELSAIAGLCREFDVLAVTDEIYAHILYEDHEHIPLAALPGMAERTITIGGLSKTFAITGWRLGFAAALEPWSKALRTVHDFTTICAPAPLQAAALAAFNLPDAYYTQLRADYTVRRDLMMQALAEAGLQAKPPEGAYYVMADYDGISFDGESPAFAEWLTTEVKVAAVPGVNFYGTPGQGLRSVRFAFPKRLETLRTAGERLRSGLRGLVHN